MISDSHDGTHVPENYWFQVAKYEERKNMEDRHQRGRGLGTVFVLDTSESMKHEGFNQMKDIFTSIIEEIAKHPEHDENVAVVTFGHTVKYAHYFTKNYTSLLHCLDDITCEGPSPITAEIALATACFALTNVVREWHVRTRVIVITDGKATDSTILNGPEDQSVYNSDRVKAHLLQVLQKIGRKYQVTCIPVGDSDLEFLEFMTTISKSGRLVHPGNAKNMGRYTIQLHAAVSLQGEHLENLDLNAVRLAARKSSPSVELDDQDMENIIDFVKNKDVYRHEEDIDDEDEEIDIGDMEAFLLPVGTRVRRGPHWKWRNQDSDGPGTVIGYNYDFSNPSLKTWTNVEWDNGLRFPYRYNLPLLLDNEFAFDIVACSEPRVLVDDELIAVGCLVTRGPDWRWGDQDGGEGQMGSVYKMNRRGIIHVRWSNGVKSNYRFGFDGKFDVEICDPFTADIQTTKSNSCISPEHFVNIPKTKCDVDVSGSLKNSPKDDIPFPNIPLYKETKVAPRDAIPVTSKPSELCLPKAVDARAVPKSSKERTVSQTNTENGTFSPSFPESATTDRSKDSDHNCIHKNQKKTSFPRGKSVILPEGHNEYIWQWKDSLGRWIAYPDDINDNINSRFNQNPKATLSIEINNQW